MFPVKSFVVLCLVALLQLACSNPGQGPVTQASPSPSAAPVTSVNLVSVSVARVDIVPGGNSEASVMIEVRDGYHVNANPATDTYLKATEVIPQAKDGLTVGYIKYPTALNKKFSFSDKQLAVYEGKFPVKVMIKADKSVTKGPHPIPTKLNIQACDDQVCYAPGTLELTVPVLVN
jgi:hypothetical protein